MKTINIKNVIITTCSIILTAKCRSLKARQNEYQEQKDAQKSMNTNMCQYLSEVTNNLQNSHAGKDTAAIKIKKTTRIKAIKR